jgi:hypothetical protein
VQSLSNVTEQSLAARPLSFPTGDALLPDSGEFRTKFNRHDFLFDHGLGHHPLFQLSALRELAQRIPKYKDFVYWQNGKVAVNDKWGTNPAKRLSLDETIEGIAHNDSLVILKHAEQDPIFGALLQEILQRIWSFTSPSAQADIVLGESLIFLNSPRRKTAYHMDLESNFLLQIAGVKHVRVFDCTDRTLTSHVELENHCRGDHNAAIYKPERDVDAHYYYLTPGHGVHFPSIGPHWVQNGDDVSISININFDLISVHQRMKHIYRMNRLMRRFGIDPLGPGTSRVRDRLKETLSRGITAVQQTLKRRASPTEDLEGESYPVWRPNRQAAAGRR